MERTSTPLAGLRIVEQAGWAGAFTGRLLADGGADVVRVVPPGGDELEQEPPFFGESGVSIQATWYNAGKRVVTLDRAGEGFRELLAEADLLIEDWRGDEAPFDAEALRDAFPQLVRLSVTPMGREGPWAGLAVNDLVATALCGAASITGTPETPPLTGYGNQTAHTIGFYAACCALAGVRLRDANGHGSHIDLSGHETLIANTEQMLMQWFFPDGGRWTTPIAQRQGSLHWSGGYEVYPDRDGNGLMVTPSLGLMQTLIPWLEETDAAGDLPDRERYPDLIALVKEMPHVMATLRDWTAENVADDLFMEAQRRRLPFGAVWPVSKAVDTPQIEARGFFNEREVEGFGAVPFPLAPALDRRRRPRPGSPCPRRGGNLERPSGAGGNSGRALRYHAAGGAAGARLHPRAGGAVRDARPRGPRSGRDQGGHGHPQRRREHTQPPLLPQLEPEQAKHLPRYAARGGARAGASPGWAVRRHHRQLQRGRPRAAGASTGSRWRKRVRV